MTGEAFRIVIRNVPDDILMRIVAGDAADARVGAIETFAVGQAVGLETNVGLAFPMGAYDGFPASMTLTAEVRDVFGLKLAE